MQVFANGGVASVLIALHTFLSASSPHMSLRAGVYPGIYAPTLQRLLPIGIIAHYGAVAADTFGSELGILAKSTPVLVTAPWKKVPRGTNGGITIEGLSYGLFASFLITCIAYVGYYFMPPYKLMDIRVAILVCGMGAFGKAERLHARAVVIDKVAQSPNTDFVSKAPPTREAISGRSKAAHEQMKSQGLSLAEKLYSQANDLYVNGKAFAAMDAAREALQLREKYATPDSLQLGLSLSQIGQLLLPQFRYEESTPYLEKGLALIEKASPESDDMSYALANFAWQ